LAWGRPGPRGGDTVEALPLLEEAVERAASVGFAAGTHGALGRSV